MAKFKNITIFVFAMFMLLSICAMPAGCARGDKIIVLQQRIDELEQENKNLSERIKDLEVTTSGEGFYSLQEAYDKELLSTEDLQAIAKPYNMGIFYSEFLGGETQEEIMRSYYNVIAEDYPEADMYDVIVDAYYGTFNSCLVVRITLRGVSGDVLYYPEYAIGGVTFNNFTSALMVWVKRAPTNEAVKSLQQQMAELKDQVSEQSNKIADLEEKIEKLIGESEDDKILQYHHEPSIDEPFADNKVIVILKSSYDKLSEISFDAFKIVELVCEINYVKYNLHQYTREETEIIYLKEEKNHMFTLGLAVNDKQTVLDAISLLQTLDMVLVAEPAYIYDIVFFDSNI